MNCPFEKRETRSPLKTWNPALTNDHCEELYNYRGVCLICETRGGYKVGGMTVDKPQVCMLVSASTNASCVPTFLTL